jgi:hypothetical protein
VILLHFQLICGFAKSFFERRRNKSYKTSLKKNKALRNLNEKRAAAAAAAAAAADPTIQICQTLTKTTNIYAHSKLRSNIPLYTTLDTYNIVVLFVLSIYLNEETMNYLLWEKLGADPLMMMSSYWGPRAGGIWQSGV